MTTYATFIEHNDHEGEIWKFYIPIEGNEIALQQLGDILAQIDDEEMFELDKTPLSEFEVAVLVKHTESGYMDQHNKLKGTLVITDDLPDEPDSDRGQERLVDLFYKGRIEEWMEE